MAECHCKDHTSPTGTDKLWLQLVYALPQKLPAYDISMAPPLTGWNDYFSMRLVASDADDSQEEKFVVEPPLIDGK